jgi:hypothetical protein
VFDTVLYIRICRFDEPAERCGICRHFGSQLYMAHEPAAALQEAGGIREGCAAKKSYVYVRREGIDVAEWSISQTYGWTAVMQDFADFVAAFSHDFKPPLRDGS